MTYKEVLQNYCGKNKVVRFSINGNFCCRPDLLRGHQFKYDHSYLTDGCSLDGNKTFVVEVLIFTSIS